MSSKCDAKKQVRFEDDVYNSLKEIQLKCEWPVTLGTLANFIIRNGLGVARKTFNRKVKP